MKKKQLITSDLKYIIMAQGNSIRNLERESNEVKEESNEVKEDSNEQLDDKSADQR